MEKSHCPLAGWCPTIYKYDDPKFILGVCSTGEHANCTIFMSKSLKAIVPRVCRCPVCFNSDCARSSFAKDAFRHKESFESCSCEACSFEGLCYPLIASGEANTYVKGLTGIAFRRLLVSLTPQLVLFENSEQIPMLPVPMMGQLLRAVTKRLILEQQCTN